jgi:alkanesulfonate monooxygenase SsuD/methylene tetrahydromethanopterin reductase-like flavin-dependent oxidoreductase (luciferase family)
MCSYFIHIAETPEEDETGRQAMMDYYQYSALRNIPDDPAKMPPNMRYFLDIREKLAVATKESMNDRSILIGTPAQIIESLKKAEAAGMDEIILYFNIGRKPHSMVIEQMDRFMRDIAPAFDDALSVGAKTAAE